MSSSDYRDVIYLHYVRDGVSGIVSSNAGINFSKVGFGTLELGGTVGNTFIGGTFIINEGTVQLNKPAGVTALIPRQLDADGAQVQAFIAEGLRRLEPPPPVPAAERLTISVSLVKTRGSWLGSATL